MNSAICRFCRPGDEKANQYSNNWSGEIILHFDSGRSYLFPSVIVHYIGDHSWNPGSNFVSDIMNHTVIVPSGLNGPIPRKMAFFSGTRMTSGIGSVPDAFLYRLLAIVKKSRKEKGYPD